MKDHEIPRGCGACNRWGLRNVALHRTDDDGKPAVTEWGVLCECARGDAFASEIESGGKRRPAQLSGWLATQRARDGYLDAFADPTEAQRRPGGVLPPLSDKAAATLRTILAERSATYRAPPGREREWAECDDGGWRW